MEIVAFIHDPDSLRRITDHYGLDTEVPALAPARGPPSASQEELFGDDVPRDEDYFADPPSDDGLPVFDIDAAGRD